MSVVLGGLVPHPPLLVPEVGGARVRDVRATQEALERLCREVAASRARRLVIVTPHGPYQRGRMSCLERARGTLARFGCPEVALSWEVDRPLAERIASAARSQGVPVDFVDDELDHALMVPLYYLRQAGFDRPLVAFSVSGLPRSSHLALGDAIARACSDIPTVVIGSGDLSHRLKDDGPYGFDARGPVFDQEVVSRLDPLDPKALAGIPEDLVEGAGVCAMKPLMVLLGAVPPGSVGEVLSYEGPFGVGYAVARLTPPTLPACPVTLARHAVEHWVAHGRELEGPIPPELHQPCGAFVTLRYRGELRGCIGTIAGTQTHRAREVIRNAIAAASRDPRFQPVSAVELTEMTYSVYFLDPAEPCSEDQLDPALFGVIVRSGTRSGVLLPGIPGLSTVAQQLNAVRRKAGIGPQETLELARFRVHKFGEDG